MNTDKKTDDTSSVINSIQKVAKGTSIAFIGSLIGLFFISVGWILIARYWTESEFGVFSLACSILYICAIISTLGLKQAVIRNIAYFRGKKDSKKIPEIISSSIWLSLAASIIIGIILFLSSEIIAERIFHETALIVPLKMFSVGIPYFTLIDILASIFRGFDRIKPSFIFQNILQSMLLILFLIPIIILNLPFINVFFAYLISLFITCLFFIIYAIRQFHTHRILSAISVKKHTTKKLLLFSLPLLGSSILQLIINQTDVLMLGGLKTSADVGLYSAARPLAGLISFPLSAVLMMYMPVISNLYGRGKIDEMKRTFSIVTKWLCFSSLPLFLILFLFPDIIIHFIIGYNYVAAATVLRILSLGFIVNNFLGPNSTTLIALGKSRFIMFATLISATLNVGLNVLLIPYFGIDGAAVASVIAIVSVNFIRCYRLHSLNGSKPLSKNLIKPTLVSLMAIFFLYYIIIQSSFTVSIWMILPLFILFYVIYFTAVLFTKSLDQEDLEMLVAAGKKIRLKPLFIRRFLTKFI
jgi:O-antigen/teichoic acid export membrane protein